MNVYEMEGFMRGKGLPDDLLVGESNAAYLVRKLNEATALKAERDALAVENMAIKAMNDCLSEELRGYESDGAFEGPHMHLLWWKAENPATDAALTAIEARSITAALDSCSEYLDTDCVMDRLGISYADAELRTSGAMELCNALKSRAAKLREAK